MSSKRRSKPTAEPATSATITPNGVEIVYANELYCTYCPIAFSSIQSKKRHEMLHEGRRPESCKQCHASFYRAVELARHEPKCCIAKELGTDTKWCNFCDNFFLTDDELNKHRIKSHSTMLMFGLKVTNFYQIKPAPEAIPLLCELCGSCFETKFLFGTHECLEPKIKSTEIDTESLNEPFGTGRRASKRRTISCSCGCLE